MFSPNTTGQIAKIPANNVAGYEANARFPSMAAQTNNKRSDSQ